MDSWQPIDAKELETLIAAQLADCSLEEQQFYERCKVALRLIPIDRNGSIENVFVVALRKSWTLKKSAKERSGKDLDIQRTAQRNVEPLPAF